MSRNELPPLQFESTGNAAFDEILGGGLPARSVIVIAGEPGSGKTILTLQTLFRAAKERGKKSLYLTTLSEPAVKLLGFMQLFDFFDAGLLDSHVRFADLGGAVREGAERTLAEIEKLIEEHEPSFVVIDSFRALGEFLEGDSNLRLFVYDLAVLVSSWGATSLLVGEYTRDDFSRFAEFAIADGIIRLGSEARELTSIRELEVLKLRGSGYTTGKHFFDIGPTGVTVFPRVRSPVDLAPVASVVPPEVGQQQCTQRASTGVAGLDELLGGGLPRGSATMLQGGTGCGKTILSLQFLVEGALRGEKGVVFTLEETPDQLRSIGHSLGWDFADLERRGLLLIRYTSPVELSADRFLHEARNEVRALGASRAVFDSLTTMALGVPSERRFKELVYALSKHMRVAGVSLVMTAESDQLLGSAKLSGEGVSFVSDNLIQLRYVEIGGRLERALSVLKARGIKHDSELRAYVVQHGGLSVIKDRYKDMRGVLTGLPVPRSEAST